MLARTEADIGQGHNNPPVDLKTDLEARYIEALNQVTELLDIAATVPDVLDDETQPKAAELIKKMRFAETTLDGARKLEKEPFDQNVKLVNGVFNTRIEKLEAARRKLNERSAAYLEKKAAAERRRLAEEEEKRRQEAAASLVRAQEAERTKNAASVAVNEYVALADAAKMAHASATTEVEQAAAKVKTCKAAVGKVQAEWLGKQADYARAVQSGAPVSAEVKEADKLAYGADLSNRKWDVTVAESELTEASQRAAAARAEQEKADEAHRAAQQQVKAAGRDVDQHLGQALKDEKRADKIATVIEGPEADLARTRSEHGAVSTLGRVWKCSISNVHLLDMRALWPHVSTDEKLIALRKWMLLQPDDKRSMPGAIMEIETVGQVR